MSKRYFNASIDETIIKLFRKKFLLEEDFKKLLKSCSIKFETINNPIYLKDGFYKHWAIFSLIPNLSDKDKKTVERLYNYFLSFPSSGLGMHI